MKQKIVIALATMVLLTASAALGVYGTKQIFSKNTNTLPNNNKGVIASNTSTSSVGFGKEIRDNHLVEVDDMSFLNGYLYQASALDGFNVYRNENNRLNYLKTVTKFPPDTPWQVRIDNDFLYLGTQNDGALIYDLHDPSNPSYLEKATFTHRINDVLPNEPMETSGGFDVGDNIMAVAGSLGEVQFAQLTNGIHPQVVGKLKYDHTKGERIARILLNQKKAFLLSENQTIFVIDLAQPDQPKQIASLLVPESGEKLYTFNSYFLILRNTNLFMVYTTGNDRQAEHSFLVSISIADPNKPTIEDKLEIPSVPHDVIMKNNRIYVAYLNGPQTFEDTAKVQSGIMNIEVNDAGKMSIAEHNQLGEYDNIAKLTTSDSNLIIFRGGPNDGSYQFAPL